MKIGIAGAGLLGRLLAWQLIQHGHHISLFDSDFTGKNSAAFTAAGMISPWSESVYTSDKLVEMGVQSLKLWPKILKDLPAIPYSQKGCLVVCHANEKAELKHFSERLSSRTTVKNITTELHQKLESELLCCDGFYLENEAWINGRALLKVLLEKLQQGNVCFIEAKVNSLKPCEIETDLSNNFDWVFDCRGIGGQQHFSELYAVRGEVIRVHAPAVNITRPIRLLHPKHPIYIAPIGDHHYVIGATEIESSDTSPISLKSCVELLNSAYSIHHGFLEARIIEMTTALRPTLFDHQPKIVEFDGLTAINGLYRHGFMLAPTLVAKMMSSE